MKANPLLAAVALLVVLGGAVWYTRENPPPDQDAAASIVELDEEALQEVAVTRAGRDTLTVVRGEDDAWGFGGGIDVPADDSSIGFMITSLASLNADRVVSENVLDWSPYELEDSELKVAYKLKEGAGGEVWFGKDTPTGSGVFARLKDDPRLFTVYSYNKSSFEKELFDLRNKQLLQVDDDKISSVTVSAGGRTVEFGKSGGDWRILKPQPLRADNFVVGDLVRAARTAEMTAVLADEESAGGYSFRRPLAVVAIVDDAGSHDLTLAKDGDTYYAKSSDQEGIYEVSSTLAESFEKPLSEFRNKKVFDFGFADPAKIEVRSGSDTVVVVKAEDKWLLRSAADRELEGEKVQTLLDGLRNLTVVEFASENASDQARYGLGEPAVQAEVTPAGDAAEPENVIVSSPERERVYAARVGEPSTYEVEKAPLNDIRRAVENILQPAEEEAQEGSEQEEPETEN